MASIEKRGVSEHWVEDSKKTHRELFSELDVLLQALDRFFRAENFSGSREDFAARNFREELEMVRDGILRVLGILEAVIPESRKNSYWFQKYAETKLMTSSSRDAFREVLYRQDSPEKGLYLLYDSFINLKGVLTDLLSSGNVSYMGFMNIGNLISRDIRENRYFNPFLKVPNPEFDVITNHEISEIVRNIRQRELRKYISVVYLYLFRILRFLGFVDVATQRPVSLNASLLTILLLRHEIAMLQDYVDKVRKKIANSEVEPVLGSIAYQFSIETKRVYLQEMRGIYNEKGASLRGRIENSQGILKNLSEQSIVQLSQLFDPELAGEDIFPSFSTRLERSLRLREDIAVLHRFLVLLEASAGNEEQRLRFFESLRSYMVYFEGFTFRMLRFDDYEEFRLFFDEFRDLDIELIRGEGFEKILERLRHFGIFLSTTLGEIGNRAELRDRPLNLRSAEDNLRKYLCKGKSV